MTVVVPVWLVAVVAYVGLGIVAMGLLWAAVEVANKLATHAMWFSRAKMAWVRFVFTGRGPLMELDKVHQEIDRLSQRINALEKWRWDFEMKREERGQSA